jgi:ferrous iron transport protein A
MAVKPGEQTLFCNLVRLWRNTRDADNETLLRRFGPPDETGHVELPLSCMLPGDDGHVLGLRGDPEVRQHLLEMGFTVGTPIAFVRIAPLGDPLTVLVRGYQLSLRRNEAEAIWMRRCPPGAERHVEQHIPKQATRKER